MLNRELEGKPYDLQNAEVRALLEKMEEASRCVRFHVIFYTGDHVLDFASQWRQGEDALKTAEEHSNNFTFPRMEKLVYFQQVRNHRCGSLLPRTRFG